MLTIDISSGTVLKNKNHKIFWDSDTQTNPTIQVRRSDIITENYKKLKKKKKNSCCCGPQSEIEREWKIKEIPRTYP